ncbi:HAD-IA family hydrolase [Eubacteriales bacterium OttesenSCG-928-N13]|nr:HAD-IA family hydrolase [Eubacteriales bacterium OttesenSCG-928-N13]
MLKAVLFDLDGTLLNTLDDLAASVNHVLCAFGLPARTTEEVRRFVGNGVGPLGERAVGEKGALSERFMPLFQAHYAQHSLDRTAPYDGVLDMLDALRARGILCGVVSNKPDAATKALCAHFFSDCISLAVGDVPGIPKKPAPDSCLHMMKQMQVTADECIYVGDADTDVNVAKNARMRFIGAAWGFRGRDYLMQVGASRVADTVAKLTQMLLND